MGSSGGHAFPPARPEVEGLQAYSAPLEGRRGLLRLDFNENTVGPSPLVVEALRAIPADQIAIYPEYDGLREALIANLADRSHGRPGLARPLLPAQIGLFNGVDAAIHAVVHAYGDRGDTLLTTSHLRLLQPLRPDAGHGDRSDPLRGGCLRLPA